MDTTVSLQIVDYIVISLVLIISLGIGVLFAAKDFRNVNRVEYLLGGRRLPMLPVAFSVFATFSSGIAYIGLTAEIYLNGTMSAMLIVGVGIGYICVGFTLVPLMYPLNLTSLYEYLEMRFDSTVVRMMTVVAGMLQTMCFMSITLLSPALAVQVGAGLPLWVSIGVIGFIGTVYTAIGGIKSVVWTDVFQSLIMMGGCLTIIIKGSIIVGGGDSVWKIAHAGGRTSMDRFSLDPRDRYTWWGGVIGGLVYKIGSSCTQSTLQRISSMKSMKEAQKAFLLTTVLYAIHSGLVIASGLVIYAYYAKIRCDPFQSGDISNINQLTIYYVMHVLTDIPGIAGIYMSIIFSGCLSTLSSVLSVDYNNYRGITFVSVRGINALAANTTEDLLKRPLKNVQESTVTFITKIIVLLYGTLIIGLAYGVSFVKGPLIKMTIVVMATWCGPVFGVFLLASLVPWGNKYGAVCGGVIALVFNIWIAVGNVFYGRKTKYLTLPETDMCFSNNSVPNFSNGNVSDSYYRSEMLSPQAFNQSLILNIETKDPYSFGFFLYDISHEWYAFIGTFDSLVLGMIISYFTRNHCSPVNDERLLFPFVRKYLPLNVPHVKSKHNGDGHVEMIKLRDSDMTKEVISDSARNTLIKC